MDHHIFSPPAYHLLQEIGRSTDDQVIYYCATAQTSEQKVIISRYIFPENKSDLVTSFDHPTILSKLKEINNDGILSYLDSFSTDDSICFVQSYCDLFPLVISPQTSIPHLYQIIIQILKILALLQSSPPQVLDCHLSPDNLWIDGTGKVYLMDFGYAQIDGQPMPLAMAKLRRNPEFIAPEQQRNRSLTEKTDLYSLGVTVVYWLLQKKVDKNATIIGSDGSINVAGLVPETVSLEWIEWLEKMLAISPKDRFTNAKIALENFEDIYLERSPNVQFRPAMVSLKANHYGEVLSQALTIVNPVPNTNLSGKIYFQDSSGNITEKKSSWLTAKPAQFNGNKINIQLTFDTGKLVVQKQYNRQLVIQANSNQKIHILPLTITTARIKLKSVFHISLLPLLFITLACSWLGGSVVSWTPSILSWLALFFGWAIGVYGMVGASFFHVNYIVQSVAIITALSIGLGFVTIGADVDLILGFINGILMAGMATFVIKSYLPEKHPKIITFSLVGILVLFGIGLGINLTLPKSNPTLFGISILCGFVVLLILAFPYWQYFQSLKKYRQKFNSLIRP